MPSSVSRWMPTYPLPKVSNDPPRPGFHLHSQSGCPRYLFLWSNCIPYIFYSLKVSDRGDDARLTPTPRHGEKSTTNEGLRPKRTHKKKTDTHNHKGQTSCGSDRMYPSFLLGSLKWRNIGEFRVPGTSHTVEKRWTFSENHLLKS